MASYRDYSFYANRIRLKQ